MECVGIHKLGTENLRYAKHVEMQILDTQNLWVFKFLCS